MPVHAIARRGFSRAYERGRPEYPASAFRILRRLLQAPAPRLLEIGAGTGKLTRGLRSVGLEPVAVEPVAAMRAGFRAQRSGAALVAGIAESLPVQDGAFDGVVVGQAFHWFAADRALDEIARVLRPGGLLVLVWNRRDESRGWRRELGRLLRSRRPRGVPGSTDRGFRSAFRRSGRFEPLRYRRLAGVVQELTVAELLDRVSSVSYIASLARPERRRFQERVRRIAARAPRLPRTGRIALPYSTDLYWTRARSRRTAHDRSHR